MLNMVVAIVIDIYSEIRKKQAGRSETVGDLGDWLRLPTEMKL